MNRIYRLIRHRTTGLIVAVSEVATSARKAASASCALDQRHPSLRLTLMASVLAAAFSAVPVMALPTTPTVVSGSANFAQNGSMLTVTNSNGTIINWQGFSIAAGETTRFEQASSASSVLNRVTGGDLSAIYGTLSSNGKVWLVNPAGIMVGATGRVDVAGFVASTLNVTNADFLANRLSFSGAGITGDVTVERGATIATPQGGSVYLVGTNVSNSGVITTPNGETILAAGNTVQLIDTATPGVKVEITGETGNATNLGEVTAQAGRIGIAGVIVKNSGTLNASSVVEDGGRVFLRASKDAYVDGNGRIVTTGSKGGSIDVLGNRVAVMDSAVLDASGRTGGGSIRVGGDYQGNNSDVPNAQVSYFGPNATLKADATDSGNGGRIIVWADDTTRAYGTISARGGAVGGDGGFVETSGKRYLDVSGARVTTLASSGQNGVWLLDPVTLTVTDTGSTTASYGSGVFSNGGADATLSWANILSNLQFGNITVQAYADLKFVQSGAWVSTYANDLTFTANNGRIYGDWGGGAGTQPTSGLNLTTAGNLAFNSSGDIQLGNGVVKTTGTKTISIASSAGSVGVGRLETGSGNISVSSYYSIFDDNWQSTGDAAVNYQTTGSVSLTSSMGASSSCYNSNGDPCLAISGNVKQAGVVTATVNSGAPNGQIHLYYHGNITTAHDINLRGYSSVVRYSEAEFTVFGSAVFDSTDEFSAYGGIYVEALGGDMTWGNTAAPYNAESSFTQEFDLYAYGNLYVNGAISLGSYNPNWRESETFVGLVAGNTVNVNAAVTNNGGMIGIASGITQKGQLDNIDTVDQLDQMLTQRAGVINVNAAIQASGDVGFLTNELNVGTAGRLVGDYVYGFIGSKLLMTGNAALRARYDVELGLTNAAAEISMTNGAKIVANDGCASACDGATYLYFAGRSAGGIALDGAAAPAAGPFANAATGSGFYSAGVPAILNSTLFIDYGVVPADPVTNSLTSAATAASTTTTPTTSTVPTFTPTTTASSTSSTTGGESGTLGSEEPADGSGKKVNQTTSDDAPSENSSEAGGKKSVGSCLK